MSQLKEKWSSRKLAVAMFSLILASTLVWFGKITADAWSMAFMATVGVYLSAQAFVDRHSD